LEEKIEVLLKNEAQKFKIHKKGSIGKRRPTAEH